MEEYLKLSNVVGTNVIMYKDECPIEGEHDYIDVLDTLRDYFAPLKLFRLVAVEFHRQGFTDEFESVLNDIIKEMANPDVEKIYRERTDFGEGMSEIFNAMAASSLGLLGRSKRSAKSNEFVVQGEHAQKVVEYLRRAEDHVKFNEYTWLIKGFYEIIQGWYLDIFFSLLVTKLFNFSSSKIFRGIQESRG